MKFYLSNIKQVLIEWVIKPIWSRIIILLFILFILFFISLLMPKPDITLFVVTYNLVDYPEGNLNSNIIYFARTPSDHYVLGANYVNGSYGDIVPTPPILLDSGKLMDKCGINCYQHWISLKNHGNISVNEIVLEIEVKAEETIDGDRDFKVEKVPKTGLEDLVEYQFVITELDAGALRSMSFMTNRKADISVNKCQTKDKSYSCKIAKYEITAYISRTEFMTINGTIVKKPEDTGLFKFDLTSSKWILVSKNVK